MIPSEVLKPLIPSVEKLTFVSTKKSFALAQPQHSIQVHSHLAQTAYPLEPLPCQLLAYPSDHSGADFQMLLLMYYLILECPTLQVGLDQKESLQIPSCLLSNEGCASKFKDTESTSPCVTNMSPVTSACFKASNPGGARALGFKRGMTVPKGRKGVSLAASTKRTGRSTLKKPPSNQPMMSAPVNGPCTSP
jgi:hypothetical protein